MFYWCLVRCCVFLCALCSEILRSCGGCACDPTVILPVLGENDVSGVMCCVVVVGSRVMCEWYL